MQVTTTTKQMKSTMQIVIRLQLPDEQVGLFLSCSKQGQCLHRLWRRGRHSTKVTPRTSPNQQIADMHILVVELSRWFGSIHIVVVLKKVRVKTIKKELLKV